MAGLSDYCENGLLDWWFRGQAFTIPATCYWRLFTANPNWETGAGGTELTGTGYTQYGQGITMSGWWSVASQGSNGGYRLTNTGTCSLTCGSDWAAITGVGLYDGNSSGSNLLFGGSFSADPGNGDTVRIAAGAIDIDFDVTTKGGPTSYTNQQMAKKLGAATPDSPLSTQYLALYTTAPDIKDGSGGTEVSGTSYARVSATPSTYWSAASGGSVKNAAQTNFAQAGSNWGTVLAVAVVDTASGAINKYLAIDAFTGVEITTGDTFYLPANTGIAVSID